MEEQNIKSRGKKIKATLLDVTTDELENAGKEAIRLVMQDIKEWVRNRYNNFKLSPAVDTEVELKILEMRISTSNENVEIGMEKKEIAIMWAMRKLGYSEEETQQVINLANEAYNHHK